MKRFFRFSLRSILVIMLAAGVGGGFFARWLKGYNEQRAAQSELQPLAAFMDTEVGRPAFLAEQFDCEDVVAISFHGAKAANKIKDEDLAPLAKCRRLRRLSLHRLRVTDAAMEYLRHCPELSVLSLKHTQIGDQGLLVLQEHAKMRKLQLSYSKVTSAGLAVLQQMPHLQVLELESLPISDVAIQPVTSMQHLQELNLGGTEVTSTTLNAIFQLPHLTTLSASSVHLHDIRISDAWQLESLFLGPAYHYPRGTRPKRHAFHFSLRNAPSLITLQCSADWVQSLSIIDAPKLSQIYVSGHHKRGEPITIRGVPNLTSATVQGCTITEESVRELVRSNQLTQLDLSRTTLDDAMLQHIVKCPSITSLTINSTLITDAGLQHLTSLKKLNHLNLHGLKITKASIQVLRQMPWLQWVYVSKGQLPNDQLKQLHKNTRVHVY